MKYVRSTEYIESKGGWTVHDISPAESDDQRAINRTIGNFPKRFQDFRSSEVAKALRARLGTNRINFKVRIES